VFGEMEKTHRIQARGWSVCEIARGG